MNGKYVYETFQENMVTDITILDVSDAFDRVWHQGRTQKMKQIGYPLGRHPTARFIS